VTCPQQFNQVLRYDGVQVNPEMVCQRESETLGFESFYILPEPKHIKFPEKTCDMICLSASVGAIKSGGGT
jgi:hypothetical protein